MKQVLPVILLCISLPAFAQSSITWSAGMNITNSSYENYHPRIVTDGSGNPVVIWGSVSDESVFISRWNGSVFTTPMKVNPSWLTVATASWMGPDIAANGDTVYVVMKQTPEVSYPIYLSTSFDGGTTFSSPVQVDFIADSVSRFPAVTVNNQGNPVVAFMKFNPDFSNAQWAVTTSSDFGNTFSEEVLASGWSGVNATVCDCCPGSIICTDNTVAMLYRDNLGNIRDMWAGISTDGGNSFTQGMALDQGNWMLMYCPSSGPDGAVIGDTLYTAFMSGKTGTSLVYFSKSSLSTMTGAPGVPITPAFMGLTSQNFPRVASAGNALAVVWRQSVSATDQLALRFSSNILNDFPVAYDTVDVSDVTNADVALTDGEIHVVWQDDNSGTVKYRKGTFTPATAIEENNSQNLFSVFPNPASDFVQLRMAPNMKDIQSVTVTDVLGNEMSVPVQFNQQSLNLNLFKLSQGMYFIKVAGKNFSHTKKLIIEK